MIYMKKRMISVLVVFLFVFSICIPTVLRANGTFDYGELGRDIASNMYSEDASDIMFDNGTIVITKGELSRTVAGCSKQDADEATAIEGAVATLVERKYFYSKAVDAGMKVSEQEYEEYMMELKASIEKAENKEDIEAYLEGFGGEDAYWDMMESTIKENLLAREYLDSQVQKYSQVKTYSDQEIMSSEDQALEEQLKREAYEDALTDTEEQELISMAHDLYELLER